MIGGGAFLAALPVASLPPAERVFSAPRVCLSEAL
jgi:hypothetical protein